MKNDIERQKMEKLAILLKKRRQEELNKANKDLEVLIEINEKLAELEKLNETMVSSS